MNKMGESKIMKKYKGVVFFDYDGTTVDEVDEIKTATPTTVESLNKLKENGYLTMLCSGRTQRFLEMDIDKFMGAITCNGSHTEVEGEFKDVFTCAKHVRENFIDITLKGVTKGDAITELIEKLGIDKKDTYAFGDADNDVEMMQAVGTGIAMGRHSEKVGEVASMVTGTVKEEGITMALKKLGLI